MRILPLLLLSACVGGDKDASETGLPSDTGTPDTDTTDTDTTDTVDHGVSSVSGTVYVQLYTTDESGDISELSWEDWGEAFPFGSIFIAAYTEDETTGELTYWDSEVVAAPNIEGDAYALTVDYDDTRVVWVYATLDYRGDGVIGTTEPIGVYPDMITLSGDDLVDGVDITIQAEAPYGGGGGGGGDDTGWTGVTLSGDVAITDPYTGGTGKILLYDAAGNGPEYYGSFEPTDNGAGADATWTLDVDANLGDMRLLGAWDRNENGLIEPTDAWGAYVSGGVNANPLAIGGVDLSALSVTIPLGIAPAVTPFVRMEGSLGYTADYSTLPAGAVVYVTALRTLPTTDFSVSELERGYDWASFSGTELTGVSLDYLLVAPSSATAYLWAYIDIDGDGVLNEAGEPVGSYGRSGRLSTGTSNHAGLDLLLQTVVE